MCGGCAFGAWVIDVEEVSRAAGICDDIKVCGRRTVIVKSGANVVTTMFSLSVGSHPCLSHQTMNKQQQHRS